MDKALALLLVVAVSSLSVFAEEVETLHPPEAAPPHYPNPHPHSPSPTAAPIHPPAHPPHHHHPHHHHHSAPAPAPVTVLPPTHHHPPTPAPVPATHHHSPTPAPAPATHHHPPTPAPAPAPAPATHHHPPTPAPVHPPLHSFPRSFVAVQGVVYTKSCKYAGLDTLLGATPVLDAVVKLECNNTKYPLVQTGKTDKNGYFYVQAPKSITTYGAHKCKVFLVSAPTGLKPSNLHGGLTGTTLTPEKPFMYQKLPFLLYNVGPLAFEPKCPHAS